ncbi:mitochondrial pyruvate dehydrogenase [Ceraceosorus bombacis]|uniref:Protein-serine/threonine kinase n=1 Tax=Ceraceosorus bombacis TaxID=401625 RepID=A0A0P1BIE7_9BASI|nr:mitochondrial pyruvate dehydrogenase [Ceraceosorus bombacis]
MVAFGRNLNPGTVMQAGSFLAEELPIRLAHRVKELDELPKGLNQMPSISRVRDWYAQSFEELIQFPRPQLPPSIRDQLASSVSHNAAGLPGSTPNPALSEEGNDIEEGRASESERLQRIAGSSAWLAENKDNVEASEERMRERARELHEAGIAMSSSASGYATATTDAGKKRIPIHHRYYADHANIKQWPPEVIDWNESFTQCLDKIKKRHDAVVTTVAQGVLEYKRARRGQNIQADVQRFLDRFYMSRIGIRILIGQHIALARTSPDQATTLDGDPIQQSRISAPSAGAGVGHNGGEPEKYVGIICTNTNVGAIAHEAIENARFVCEEHYGLFKGPPVQLICPKDLTFMYVPSHLNHMMFELLKNSLRAVVERYGVENEDNFPPIKVIVVEGKEDITIKISDEGGGIPRSEMSLVWTYMYTTAQSEDLDPDFQASDFKAPMAGFGYGLPLARLYARYFGGDLKLISMEGYGTDVYLHLNRLSSSAEPLP